ncbi:70403aa0-6342-48bb-b9ff-29b7eaa1316c [Sclerotinia trifoliorum]|uniref:70403aa0-6342-48bb-b9ff-29b7eaa1316c n=1 Tax=Sclerotinia trifoliorum TaxID=28548 RepID=A0A8H2W4C0_9HELO|nr:70403aa0-6342-48bb-b9ff-29b7eaa1316c [Sclerotinia trifoliorum]
MNMASTIKPGLPTFHHLDNSQSQRVLWFLEELGIEYNLVCHKRIEGRAPPELKNVHPMGKAPVLVTSDNRPIVESSAILGYLIDTYDKEGRFAAQDKVRDEILTSFAGSTIGTISVVELIFDIVAQKSPWPLSILMGGVKSNIHKSFTGPEYATQFEYLEKELTDEWFNGKNLGRPDVMLSWPVDFLAAKKYVDFEKYPKILQWRNRIQNRDAWKRALEKGNGYDLMKV